MIKNNGYKSICLHIVNGSDTFYGHVKFLCLDFYFISLILRLKNMVFIHGTSYALT